MAVLGLALANTNVTPTISFLLTPDCEVPNDFFSGDYQMEQLSGTDPFFAVETFGDTQTVNIKANGLKRTFPIIYYSEVPNLIHRKIYNVEITLTCNGEILVSGSIEAGVLNCNQPDAASLEFTTGIPVSTYTVSEVSDDIVLVNITDYVDPDDTCGESIDPYQVELRFTEL